MLPSGRRRTKEPVGIATLLRPGHKAGFLSRSSSHNQIVGARL